MMYFVGVALFLVIATLVMGVKIVPQGREYLIARFGRYHATLRPGLNFIVPYIDTVAQKITTMDQPLDIPAQEVITQDNAVIVTNAIAFIKVVTPEKAAYGITNYKYAIQNLIMTTLRGLIGSMTLNEALTSREKIKATLKEQISDDVTDWGVIIKSVEIQDIRPSEAMQIAMEKQAGAERLKQAAILEAEGKKEAAIREAEGKLEASKKEAAAQIALAEASAEAIDKITQAIGNNETPAMFLLGDRYIESIKSLAASNNAKTFILPSDILGAVKGLIGKA